MSISKSLLETKNSILSDANSAINIIEVVEKIPGSENVLLHIKTSDAKNVDASKLLDICAKHSVGNVWVTYSVPNSDLVSIFIDGAFSDFDYHL